jgi:hypothetical protein
MEGKNAWFCPAWRTVMHGVFKMLLSHEALVSHDRALRSSFVLGRKITAPEVIMHNTATAAFQAGLSFWNSFFCF